MRVRRDLSSGTPAMLQQAEAIAQQARDFDQLSNFALQLWPGVWLFRERTGCRIQPNNNRPEFIVIEFCEPALEMVTIRRAAA